MHIERNYKAKKGLIRINMDVENNIIKYIKISGDFFMFPQDAINNFEKMLININVNNVSNTVKKFYCNGIITPGVEPEDFIKALTVI